jgi:CRP/FNR family transcriptional regulator, anaerobic regulatory protein
MEADIDLIRPYVSVRCCKHATGQRVYRAGQPFQALYLIHAGSCKTCTPSDDGREMVAESRVRGDLVGIESRDLKTHSNDAIAQEDSEAWELPYSAVLRACLRVPEWRSCLVSASIGEIHDDRSWMPMLCAVAAERRVAAFLLDAAARHDQWYARAKSCVLRMSYKEMAGFLALTHEMVGRTLSHLHARSYITVQRRDVRVLNINSLRAVAGAGPW